ncbi:hypothetical protein C8F04DRAFT_547755 [Mycena alexandri]|uniref:Arylesterase n=1 Tax=Mycena alexandri TaxID=1745969 RepID=A0AAD6SVV9_9AGAR|nr:hypothetical protein C8F04DRAFT_547755 [Mycena alexandri]
MKSYSWLGVLAISMLVWRSRRTVTYVLLKRESPTAVYAQGNADAKCVLKTAPEMNFCEDAAFWELHNDAFTNSTRHEVIVTCDPGRKEWNTVLGPLRNPEPHGGLWVLSAEDDAAPKRLTLQNYPPGHDFHPLGLAISPSYQNGPSNVFVVNHARQRTFIEQFTLSPAFPGAATHVRTLSSSYFVSPNSIALTSPHSFYLTNDHLFTRRHWPILPIVETMLGLPFGWVSHISLDPNPEAPTSIIGHSFSAPFVNFANGVSISPSGLQVAVASTGLARVEIYSRDPATNVLTHTRTVPVPFSPDNLEFDAAGALIVAGHPHFPSLLKVKADPTTKAVAPSWVVSVVDNKVETLFQSDGTVFSSSSTGLRDPAGALYITGLYESGMLVCRP